MGNAIYNSYKASGGSINLLSDMIMCALVTDAYSPDVDTHENFDDITNEITATGYITGGVVLVGQEMVKDNVNNRGLWNFTDPYWDITGGLTARGAVFYKYNANPALAELIAYYDFGSNQTITNGRFIVNVDVLGALAFA